MRIDKNKLLGCYFVLFFFHLKNAYMCVNCQWDVTYGSIDRTNYALCRTYCFGVIIKYEINYCNSDYILLLTVYIFALLIRSVL